MGGIESKSAGISLVSILLDRGCLTDCPQKRGKIRHYMSREIRKVPADFKHPKGKKGRFIGLHPAEKYDETMREIERGLKEKAGVWSDAGGDCGILRRRRAEKSEIVLDIWSVGWLFLDGP